MNNQPMQFAPMAPMAKNNNNQMMMQMMQAALARGAKPGAGPVGPQQGATLPGGAMNLVPQAAGGGMGILDMLKNPGQMGLLSKLFGMGGPFGGMQGAQPGAPLAQPMPMDSTNALY